SADVTVALSPSDAGSGVASTEYRVDAGSFQPGTTVVVPAPADHSNDRIHTVEYRSTDGAGNLEQLRTATVRIDTTPPAATAVVASVAFRLEAGGATTFTTIGTDTTQPYSTTLNTPGLPDGDARLQALVTDLAGNTTLSATRTVTLDNTPPTVSLAGVGA